jgi:hypothetical protein
MRTATSISLHGSPKDLVCCSVACLSGAFVPDACRMQRPKPCGFHVDCLANYTSAEVNASAALWSSNNEQDTARLRLRHQHALNACSSMRRVAGSASNRLGKESGTLATGGWCLAKPKKVLQPYSEVVLPRNQSYFLPEPHLAPDRVIVGYLAALLSGCDQALVRGAACSMRTGLYSLSDFGAGMGQYGHALLSLDPRHRWTGYDGAGNAEEVSNGFVHFFDLSLPMSLPRTDWVMSLEVGEHIPPQHEMMYLRNLHAHNCRGLVLSWAYLGKWGVGHVNAHSKQYLVDAVSKLGYHVDWDATAFLRKTRPAKNTATQLRQRNVSEAWFWLKSAVVYRRITPLTGVGCSSLED